VLQIQELSLWGMTRISRQAASGFSGMGTLKADAMREAYIVRKSESNHAEYEHRMIAEDVLGRRLSEYEVVHHINGRCSDNAISNLCVMDSIEHDRYHKWYDWVYKTYGKYPRRETQLKKLSENFKGTLLVDSPKKRTGSS